jgi:uncharacterized protein
VSRSASAYTRGMRFLLSVVISCAVLGAVPARAQDPPARREPGPGRRTITVAGEGEARGKPDIARATLGVDSTAGKVGPALQDANARMAALLAAIRRAGVAEKDIRTTEFSVYFEQDPAQPRPGDSARSSGRYHVRNAVEITIRELARASDVLDAALAAGGNAASGLSFAIGDPAPLRARAREDAVADARRRAEALARAAGVTLGPVLSISEGASAGPRPMAARMMAMSAGPPVEAGELAESAQVEIVYEIAPGALTSR